MSWFDVVIVFILLGSLLWGLKTGLLEVIFLCAGILLGWWLSGRYADDVGEMVSFSARADALLSAMAYLSIMSVCAAIFVMMGRVVKTIAVAGTLGAAGVADRIAGVALGLVIGLVISGALIVVLARLAFDFTLTETDLDIPTGGYVAVDTDATLTMIEDKRNMLVDGLLNSRIVSLSLQAWDALPRISFGPVVGDFAIALDLLAREASDNELALHFSNCYTFTPCVG